MHEATLMADLMGRLADVAKVERARRITRVSVWLGALSHISAEHFTEHFKHASHGTVAEGAWLDVSLSDDIKDEHAQDIVLERVELET